MNTSHEISQDEFEGIEQYLNQNLSDGEKTEFEGRLASDEQFKAKVDIVRTILSGVETKAMSEQLQDFHKVFEPTQKPEQQVISKDTNYLWKRLAFAAALIIAAGSYFWIGGNSNNRLYNRYFIPDPGLPTAMGTDANYEFNKAMVIYKLGDYNSALSGWKSQLEKKPGNDTLNYFIGSALMASKQPSQAIPYLKEVTQLQESKFKDEASFYLGLAYLKNGNLDEARMAFEQSDIPKSTQVLEDLD